MVDNDRSENGPGLGLLARRITTWTTNSLLTAILLVAGVGFGRQVLQWWRAEASGTPAISRATPPASGPDAAAQVHELRFGDQAWSVRRQEIRGAKSQADAALRDACRQLIAGAGTPNAPPTDAERQFLAELGSQKPIEQEPGQWRLYAWKEGMPMAVAVWEATSVDSGASGPMLAEPGPRVVIWGIAIPTGPDDWAVYLFQPDSTAGSPPVGIIDVPLPPGCARLISVRAAGDGAIMAFRGSASPEACRRFFDHWCTEQGWKIDGTWHSSGTAWRARFGVTKSPGAAVDIRIGIDAQGQCTGLVMVGTES